MFQVRENMIHNNFCLVFLEIIFLFTFSGCSKNEVTKIITSLPPINENNNLAVGASARDFLSATKYNEVDIEIQFVDGFQPERESINNLLAFLNGLTHKNGRIAYHLKPITSPLKNDLTLNDIATIEKNKRTIFTTGTRLGVYILYIDAYYSQGNIIGISYRNTSMCLFGKSIFENSGRVGQPTKTALETSIMLHEFGHLLGLVDMGTPMQINHKDMGHRSHCTNSGCLMYFAFDVTELIKYILPNTTPVLDINCKADLKANGGK